MDARIINQRTAAHFRESLACSKFRHFKGGEYIVVDVAIHSETAEPMVIYKSADNMDFTWARPLTMFLSEVDRDKYPDATQQWRFERIYDQEMTKL